MRGGRNGLEQEEIDRSREKRGVLRGEKGRVLRGRRASFPSAIRGMRVDDLADDTSGQGGHAVLAIDEAMHQHATAHRTDQDVAQKDVARDPALGLQDGPE